FLYKCRSVQAEQRDDAHTYANVKQENTEICANVEQKDDAEIYTNVEHNVIYAN
ncbi:Uncharacterized protein DAT39_011994, partial [Clarias magur]